MKRVLFMILICASFAAAQSKTTIPVKTITMPVAPGKDPLPVPVKRIEIPIEEWSSLAVALDREDWRLASELAYAHLQSMKTDNAQKQLAQLRYIYLYAMAGRILAVPPTQAETAGKLWDELDVAMATFINKEIVMPARPFATSCEKRLNVVCRSKYDPLTMRTTSVGQKADAIHSFDYVKFTTAPDLSVFEGKNVFMGGILRKADYNDTDPSKPWALRLYVNQGFIRVVIK